MNDTVTIVAIDGPSASGKSTVSKRVAKALDFVYVDSGALYRGVTWKAVREGIEVTDHPRVIEMMRNANWEFFVEDRSMQFTIDGENPGLQLRSEPVRERVAEVATIAEVRLFIVERLRESARFGPVVMEGRDIGSVVFPATPFKFYLDADAEERARRRHREIIAMEGEGEMAKVLDSLKRRDTTDRSRKLAPLQIPLGAHLVDTTAMTIDEVVALIVDKVQSSLGAEKSPQDARWGIRDAT